MKYHLVIKRSEIIKFEGKRMELWKNSIKCTNWGSKDKYHMFSLILSSIFHACEFTWKYRVQDTSKELKRGKDGSVRGRGITMRRKGYARDEKIEESRDVGR